MFKGSFKTEMVVAVMDELESHETSEEKVAVQIGDLLSNFRLDLDSVGFYIARAVPYEIYYRFETVAEAARKFNS